MNYTVTLLIILFCLISSGYFSATETAFSSLNKTKLKTMAEKGNRKALKTLDVAEKYDKLLSTILIGNNIVNIALASLSTLLFVELLKDPDMGATVSTIVSTVVVLIFGEITPKSAAKDSPEKFAMFSMPLIRILMVLFTPLNFIFSLWKKLMSLFIKSDEENKMSQDELLMFVEEVQQEGSIDEEEGELLRNAIEFGERTAEDILTHRVDIEAVPVDTEKEEIAKVFTQMRFSRLLVYEESIDNIIGVIHQKDLYENGNLTSKSVEEIMSEPIYVQRSGKIDDLLKQLQTSKSHMAVVLDEYGGTYGIVTMEDILEELVGDIWDEHDEIEEPIKEVESDTYLVDGAVPVEEFCDFFGVELETESVSLGGWIMEQMEELPEEGDRLTYAELSFEIAELEVHRIVTVKVVGPRKEKESIL